MGNLVVLGEGGAGVDSRGNSLLITLKLYKYCPALPHCLTKIFPSCVRACVGLLYRLYRISLSLSLSLSLTHTHMTRVGLLYRLYHMTRVRRTRPIQWGVLHPVPDGVHRGDSHKTNPISGY